MSASRESSQSQSPANTSKQRSASKSATSAEKEPESASPPPPKPAQSAAHGGKKSAPPFTTSKPLRTTSSSAKSRRAQPYTLPQIPYNAPPPPPPGGRMNPPFSMNGPPYSHSHPHAPPAPYHSTPSPHPHNGVAHPPPPYGYHPIQHYPSQYHPYPNYHPMMPYSPPPPPPQHPQTAAEPSPSASASASSSSKRKRKGTVDSGKGKSSERTSDVEDTVSADMHKKRTKTQRACDSCRSRKIRCDVLNDVDPPVCQHCKQYGFECTFFLPITETRFKKKRVEEETTQGASSQTPAEVKEKPSDAESHQQSPKPEGTRGARIDGPTSMTHLLHSTATVPPRAYHSYDQRYHHTWEVSKTGDGLIQVLEPTSDEAQSVLPKPIDLRVERDVIEKLINSYFTDVAPLVPIVTQAEFLALSDPSPPPILLYSICLVAACKRDVPQTVFDSLRVAVNDVIKSEDVLCTASIVNVQSLLILCQCADCHSQFVPNALSSLWIRLGTAIRMAQDLGLHRAEAVKKNIEMRRRVWGACVISDRWISLTYGHPFMIDVEDCDARLPTSDDPNDLYSAELLRLSLILGRVLKTIYSPSGLTYATDEKLYALFHDIIAWKENLPQSLKFTGPDTPRPGGLLHLLFSSVLMIFWRVFMRISYSCPEHLKFGMSIDQWTELVQMTADSIDWLDKHDDLYDVWMLVAYAATSCALVQYHTWVRRKDTKAQSKLRKLRDCVCRWESCLQPEHMSTRRKTAEIISLLYETTQGPPVSLDEPPALNPTGGVQGKLPSTFKGLKYKQDPSRPGGGIFVATGKAKEGDYTNMPEGVVVINSGVSDEESEGEGSAAEVSSLVRPTNDPASSSSSPRSPVPPSGSAESVSLHNPNPMSRSAAGVASSLSTSRMMALATQAASAGAAEAAAPGTHSIGSLPSMVNYTPLAGGHPGSHNNFANVNPSMNMVGSSDVQVLNVLDVPQAPNTLEQFAAVDSGLLEGLPGGMFDWPQWENFFSRFNATDPSSLVAYAQAQQHAQHQAGIRADLNAQQNASQTNQMMYQNNPS